MTTPSSSSLNSMMNESGAQKLDINLLYVKTVNILANFDSLFGNIVRISNDVHDIRSNSAVLIDKSAFTPDQSEAVVQLSGYILTVFQHIQSVRLQTIHENSVMKNIPVALSSALQQEETTTKMQRRISLLQDMLVQEMNKAEDLEVSLRASETELLKEMEEKKDLQKKYDRLLKRNNGGANSSNSNQIAAEQSSSSIVPVMEANSVKTGLMENPTALIGRYIRKQFDNRKYFAVITSYDAPFFLVIYEDGDREDIDARELRDLLWDGMVPSINKSLMARHEKLFLESQGTKSSQTTTTTTSSSSSSAVSATSLLIAADTAVSQIISPPKTKSKNEPPVSEMTLSYLTASTNDNLVSRNTSSALSEESTSNESVSVSDKPSSVSKSENSRKKKLVQKTPKILNTTAVRQCEDSFFNNASASPSTNKSTKRAMGTEYSQASGSKRARNSEGRISTTDNDNSKKPKEIIDLSQGD